MPARAASAMPTASARTDLSEEVQHMTVSPLLRGCVAITVATALFASAASAQTQPQAQIQPPVAAAAGQGLGGPVVPGVCLISREAVLANSKVGIAAAARVRQLTQEAQAEVDAERKPLEAQAATLQAQAATLTADQRRAQEKALSEKFAPIQAKAELRSREIERTRAKAIDTIAAQTQPVIAAVYKQHNCGLLFDRAVALGGNFGNDLTIEVVRALDARITTIDFKREDLSGQPAPKR